MMEYMRDGGMMMWMILAAALGTAVLSVVRPAQSRPVILAGGSILSLILGLLGMAMGMVAVSQNYDRFPDKVAAVAAGLGELSNNGTFGAALAALLGLGAIVARFRTTRA